MYKLELKWKDFSVDLSAIDLKLRADYPTYTGNQAHSYLELWFTEEPDQTAKDAIQALWDGITKKSAIAKSYKTQDQIKADQAALKQSAIDKLVSLGLTPEQVEAFRS